MNKPPPPHQMNTGSSSSTQTWLLWLVAASFIFTAGCDQYSWWERYRYNKKQPYDLYALYELLDAREAGLTFNEDTLGTLLLDSITNSNYVYTGINMNLSEADVTALLSYVEIGNSAFIFSKGVPEDLTYHLFGPDCFYFTTSGYYNDVSFVSYDTLSFQLKPASLLPDTGFVSWYARNFEPYSHSWAYIDSARICDPAYGIEVLGTLGDGYINFLRLGWGKGYLYLNTTPELLTNYYLSDSSRMHYALGVFSHLKAGPVFWDEYARNYRPPPQQNNPNQPYNPNGGRQLLTDNHALRYVLEQPMLAFAWYVFIIGALLYLLFRSKRRQKTIPVIHPPENSSLQYVETIAQLAYQHGNHRRLALREIKMLRHHLSERYQLRWPEGKDAPPDLAERTGLPQPKVNKAINQIKKAETTSWMEPSDLLDFYTAIRVFYRN